MSMDPDDKENGFREAALLVRNRCALHLPQLSYVPDYLTAAEEDRLLREVHASQAKWVKLSGRRLQNHGGVVHAKGLIPAPLPAWLQQPLLARLAVDVAGDLYGGQPPNHVLVNSYMPGEGIMAHEDGPSYLPGVAIVSLGAPAVLRFWRKAPEGGAATLTPPPAASLLLMPRSVVAFSGEAFTDCLHSIDEVEAEKLDASVANLHCHPELGLTHGSVLPRGGERVSLTVRRVARVMPSILRARA